MTIILSLIIQHMGLAKQKYILGMSDQALYCQLTESLDTIECIDGEQ